MGSGDAVDAYKAEDDDDDDDDGEAAGANAYGGEYTALGADAPSPDSNFIDGGSGSDDDDKVGAPGPDGSGRDASGYAR